MNIKQKKKQLVAAALTLALSAGTVAPALAVAPNVSAATNAQHGSIMLDTANYIMAPGNIYDIGMTIKDGNGNKLTGDQMKNLVSSGKIKVRDSRTGSVANLAQLSNGNFRVTGKNEGTCYIVYEGGGNHASVRIDVKKGVKQHGTAVRNTSYFAQNIGISKPTTTMTPSTTTPSTTTPSTTTPSTTPTTIYKVTFSANGGYVATPTMTTNTSGKLASLPTPTRTGYTFNGWYTASSGGSKITTSTTFSKDTTLYAQWTNSAVTTPPTTTETTYKVTFNANGGSAGASSKTTNSSGKLSSLPTATRSGYTFDGWYTARSGGSEISTNTTFSKNTTVYAQWTESSASTKSITYKDPNNKYTVTIPAGFQLSKTQNGIALFINSSTSENVGVGTSSEIPESIGMSLSDIEKNLIKVAESSGSVKKTSRQGNGVVVISRHSSGYYTAQYADSNGIYFTMQATKNQSTLENIIKTLEVYSVAPSSTIYKDPNGKYTVTVPAGYSYSKSLSSDSSAWFVNSAGKIISITESDNFSSLKDMSAIETFLKDFVPKGQTYSKIETEHGMIITYVRSSSYYAMYGGLDGTTFYFNTNSQATRDSMVKSLKISYSGSSSSSVSISGSSSSSTPSRTYTDPNKKYQVTIPAGFTGNGAFSSEEKGEMLTVQTVNMPTGYSGTLLKRFLTEAATDQGYTILSTTAKGNGYVVTSKDKDGGYMAQYGDSKGINCVIISASLDGNDSRATFDAVVNSLKILK